MVRLAIASTKTNNIRFFPFYGYLGLTPVKVDGVVLTRLDQDLKPLATRSISVAVRCYELLLGRTGVIQSNVLAEYSKVLWEKPEDQDYADVGDLELPFRLALPARVGGHSTASFVEYRCIWRVEAVLNHVYITGVGSRQVKHSDLPLVRYDVPNHLALPSRTLSPAGVPALEHQTVKPRSPRIRYTVLVPTTPIGPMDLVSVTMYLQPSDTSVVIRSASAIIERRIHTKDTPGTLSSSPVTPSQSTFSPQPHSTSPYQEPYHGSLDSSSSLLSSNPTITPDAFASSSTSVATDHRPLLYQASTSTSSVEVGGAKASIHPIAGTESSGAFHRDPNGIFTKTLTMPWPLPKSNSRWATGETMQTEFISVKFFVRVKIIVTSATGTDSIDLDDQELFVVSTNEAERQLALSNYTETQRDTTRSKSKSPRRARKPADDELPLPPAPAPTFPRPMSRPSDHPSSSRPSSSHGSKPKAPRRPHTSAGPRDMASKFSLSKTDAPSPRVKFTRPGTMEGGGSTGPIRTRDIVFAPRMGSAPSTSSSSSASTMTSATTVSSFSSQDRGSADIREWEQELARIELQSRRSSDLLGFGVKRHRPSTATRILITGDS